jgi:hypothetical protein
MWRTAHVFLVVFATMLYATVSFAFDSGAILLRYPANARIVAMGDIGVSDNSDPSTIFFNPANVCARNRIYGVVSQQRWDSADFLPDDFHVRRANAGFSRGSSAGSPWTFGADIGYGRFSYGESIATNTDGTVLDTIDTYEEVGSLGVGVGFRATETLELRFGAGVKHWHAHFAGAEVGNGPSVIEFGGTSFDAGFVAALHERYGAWNITPGVGAAIIDAGPDVEVDGFGSDPLPTRLNFGASVRIESAPVDVLSAHVPLLAVVCQSDGIKPLHDDFEWGIGNEIAVAQILFLRNGVRRYARRSGDDATYSSWGAGVGIPAGPLRMRFDYGTQKNSYEKDHMDLLVEWTF